MPFNLRFEKIYNIQLLVFSGTFFNFHFYRSIQKKNIFFELEKIQQSQKMCFFIKGNKKTQKQTDNLPKLMQVGIKQVNNSEASLRIYDNYLGNPWNMSFALPSFELEESELNLREGIRGENTLQFIESRQNIVLNSIGWGENGEVLPLHNQEPVSLEESLKKPLKKRSQDSERRKKKVGCTCCKTKCLKKYCDCFRNGNFCTAQCSCKVCFNTKEYEKHVKKAREAIKLKDAKKAEKGCNCKKSQCRKNYCRCFELGVGCTAACKCINCANFDYSAYQQVRTSSVGLSKFMNEQD